MFGGAYKSSRADDDGLFLFDGIPPGSYLLIGQSPGYLQGEAGGIAPGPDERQVVLSPASTLRGVVVDRANGAPITRFVVEVKPAAAVLPDEKEKTIPALWEEHSDAEGRFARDDLEPGLYKVRVRAAGYVTATAQVSLASGATVALKLRLHVQCGW